MKDLDKLMLEALIEKTFKPPTRTFRKRRDKDITVKELVKILRKAPELKKELEEAFKTLEKKDEKKKDHLSFGQKYMLWTIAAVTIPPLYVILMSRLFTTLGVH